MTNKLLEKLLNSGSIKGEILEGSDTLENVDIIPTEIPIINLAFSGELDKGFTSGLTVLAGEPATFKTLLGLYCLRAYFQKYKDAVCLFYNSEWGVTKKYLESMEIDTSRIIHLPLENLEQLTQDIRQRLEEIKKGNKVFIFIDSIGNTASVKEATDALTGHSVTDMSRPKAIKSLFRIITPHLASKVIPCVAINHTYKSMDMHPTDVVSGGSGIQYSAHQIFVITKAREINSAKELIGQIFTINIYKSRFVKWKSKFPFTVLFDKGIAKWSGMREIAEEGGFVSKAGLLSLQWINPETGEIKKCAINRLKTNDDFWQDLVYSERFKNFTRETYALGETKLLGNMSDIELEENDLEDDNDE